MLGAGGQWAKPEALLLCLPLLRAFFHLEHMASVGVRSSEASAPNFYCVLTLLVRTQLNNLHTFALSSPWRRVSIPSSYGLVNSAKMKWISEVDKSTISGHSKIVVIFWGNFSWWSRSTLMFHSATGDRKRHVLVLLPRTFLPWPANWIGCWGVAWLPLLCLKDFSKLAQDPIVEWSYCGVIRTALVIAL